MLDEETKKHDTSLKVHNTLFETLSQVDMFNCSAPSQNIDF